MNSDLNPLHIDPDVARNGGFERPVLHGLCTMGLAYRSITENVSNNLEKFSCRFTGVVYPGDKLSFKIWK